MIDRLRKGAALLIGAFSLITAAVIVIGPDHPCHPSNEGNWSWWLAGCWLFTSEAVTLSFLFVVLVITGMSLRLPNTPTTSAMSRPKETK